MANTGRNLNGDFMPLFFKLSDPTADLKPMPWGDTWYQPLLFYVIALVLQVAPMSEATVRLPVAIIGGVITPILLYAVALRVFKQRAMALLCAAIFALTPPQIMLSRQALDYICPLPFVLGWLWFLIDYTETRRARSLFLGGLCLGFGFYSYIASWVMMPVYIALSAMVLWRVEGRRLRPLALSIAGFALPLLLLIPWLWTHPAMLRETFDRYQMQDQDQVSLIQERANPFRLDKIAATVSTYWGYFDPSFLFMIGGPSLTYSTGRIGVFLLPLAILLPIGVITLIRRPDPFGLHALILVAVILAPLPATLKGQPFVTPRVMFMMPFAALIATYGFEWLWNRRWRVARGFAIALLIVGAVQFAVFYRDYFTHYKLRSAFYYDAADTEGLAEYLMADSRAPLLFLSVELHYIGAKWPYYTTRDGRTDLLPKTRFVLNDGLDLGPGDAGSLLAIHVKNEQINQLEAGKLWTVEKILVDVDNRPTVAVLRKLQ